MDTARGVAEEGAAGEEGGRRGSGGARGERGCGAGTMAPWWDNTKKIMAALDSMIAWIICGTPKTVPGGKTLWGLGIFNLSFALVWVSFGGKNPKKPVQRDYKKMPSNVLIRPKLFCKKILLKLNSGVCVSPSSEEKKQVEGRVCRKKNPDTTMEKKSHG